MRIHAVRSTPMETIAELTFQVTFPVTVRLHAIDQDRIRHGLRFRRAQEDEEEDKDEAGRDESSEQAVTDETPAESDESPADAQQAQQTHQAQQAQQTHQAQQADDLDALSLDADTRAAVLRERRLATAVAAQLSVWQHEALQRVVWELDDIKPVAETLAGLGLPPYSEATLLEQIKSDLTADDLDYLAGACEVDLFYDNTTFYQEAFETTVGTIQITPVAD